MDVRDSVDRIIDRLDDLLLAGKFAECNVAFEVAFESASIEELADAEIVTWLGITLAAASKLPARAKFFAAAVQAVSKRRGAEGAEKLLGKYRGVFDEVANGNFSRAYAAVAEAQGDVRKLNLSEVGLDDRACNTLEAAGIYTVGDMADTLKDYAGELLKSRNVGSALIEKVTLLLEALGCYVRPTTELTAEARRRQEE